MKKFIAPILILSFAITGFGQAATPSPGEPKKAEAGSQADQLPDTTLGAIMRNWFAAVNSGSDAEIRQFVESNFSAKAFRFQRSAEDFTAYFVKLHRQSGGLDIVKVIPPVAPQPMAIIVKTRRGDHYGRVTVGTDSAEPGKLAGLGIDKTDAPNAARLRDLTEPLSEQEMISAIKKHLDSRADAGSLSGVVLIAKNDKLLLAQAHGYADRESKIANTLDTKFHLASVGKMFTAVAIAQLVKAGKLSFDDTVAKVLPDYPNKDVAEKVTIHQLLTHSAGLGTFFESPGFVRGKKYDNSIAEIEVYKDEKLYFEPGTKWRYSNAGYSLLGAVIERISGKSYLEYVRENIFRPLGMDDTYDNVPGSAAPNSSVFYTQSPADPLGLDPFTPNTMLARNSANAFGGGFSTARDLLKFLRAYRTAKLVGDPMLLTMISRKVPTTARGTEQDAYGIFEVDSNGETVRGHSGGSRTDVRMLWNSGYTVIVLTNAIPPAADSISSDMIGFITNQSAARAAKAVNKK